MEQFKQSSLYPAYLVGDNGTVINQRTNKPITISEQLIDGEPTGYLYCTLVWNLANERFSYLLNAKRISVHRFVALTWIEQTNPLQTWVNHKDGNKKNNSINNLEWSTPKENIEHSIRTGLRKPTPKGTGAWLGKTMPQAMKDKMSKAKKGEKHPKFKGYYCFNGIRYASSYNAAKLTGWNYRTIIKLSKANKKGWSFEPISELMPKQLPSGGYIVPKSGKVS